MSGSSSIEQPCSLDIKDGAALAEIDPIVFQNNNSIRDDLTKVIESRFYAVQIMNHRDFELSKSSRIDVREDGKKNHFLEVHCMSLSQTMDSVDLIIKDKDGNVVSDTKKERLEKQEWFASVVDQHRASDGTLNQILLSYQMSVKDPGNELVHLYEIRDALSKRFGGMKGAIKRLGVTKHDWDKIGKLANTLPLKQGRHRGNFSGLLRDAESSELEQGRRSVAHLVEKYIEYLEHKQ